MTSTTPHRNPEQAPGIGRSPLFRRRLGTMTSRGLLGGRVATAGLALTCAVLANMSGPTRALADKRLAIAFAGTAGGSVAVSVTGDSSRNVTCDSACVIRLRNDDVGTLTAAADAGSAFVSWTGQTNGITRCSGNTCSFSMGNTTQEATVTFDVLPTSTPTPTITDTPTSTATPTDTPTNTPTSTPITTPIRACGSSPYTVNTTDDHDDRVCDGDCTLREAVGCCIGGTVHVPAGTYTLRSQIRVTQACAIDGAGVTSTILSGNDTTRVLKVSATTGTVALSDLTITHGKPAGMGGGILHVTASALTVTDCALTYNRSDDGDAIENGAGAGPLTLTRCEVANNGPDTLTDTYAIFASGGGNVTIIDSSIHHNEGGGVLLGAGTHVISGSTFYENTDMVSVSPALNVSANGVLTLTNSTLDHNSTVGDYSTASGANVRVVTGAAVTANNVTIVRGTVASGNPTSANIWVDGADSTLSIENSIVSGGSGAANCSATDGGTIISGGNNLEDSNSCGFAAP
jgi:CSLREA domain-containing protein